MDTDFIGANIKKFRKLKGYTQEQLAEAAGIETKHITKLESGKHLPNIKTLHSILKALNIGYDDIGLGLNVCAAKMPDNSFYIKSLKILNGAAEEELELYYGLLAQGQKCIKMSKTRKI